MRDATRHSSIVVVALACASAFCMPQAASASDLEVRNAQLIAPRETGGETRVLFDVSWDNSWRNQRNHDAAWVFVKLVGPNGQVHLPLAASGHRVFSLSSDVMPDADLSVAKEGTGVFLAPGDVFRGSVAWRVSLHIGGDIGAALERAGDGASVQVYGIEMVYIPQGPFYVGDPDPVAARFASYWESDASGNPANFYHVQSESAIAVGPRAGHLYYAESTYGGDQQGPIPAAFPKGVDAFYLMKYELTQGQYAAFLNSLGVNATLRTHFDDPSYTNKRGSIVVRDGYYEAEYPDRGLNFMHWDDGLAFADWAGLRPMTEFEFTKAARGPEMPQTGAFPWGTASRERLARIVDTDDNLNMTNGWDEDMLSDETRDIFGASYYWVMDLAGSVWERVISPSRADGRVFIGSHGDGTLADSARATNPDWPHGYLNREGHGYRGGGFYDQGRPVHEFNPWSPVAYRRFGGWSGYDVHRAYGFRAARSADG